EVRVDLVDGPIGGDPRQRRRGAIVERHERLRLLLVDLEPAPYGLGRVVRALDELAAAAVALAGLARRIEVDVVDGAALRAAAAAAQALDERLVRGLEEHDEVDLPAEPTQHLVEALGL